MKFENFVEIANSYAKNASNFLRIEYKIEFHAMTSYQDAWYLSLLGLAEEMRSANPPKIRLCIQCLTAVLNLNQPARIESRTLMQLGNIYYVYTKNLDAARLYLEKAVRISFLLVRKFLPT